MGQFGIVSHGSAVDEASQLTHLYNLDQKVKLKSFITMFGKISFPSWCKFGKLFQNVLELYIRRDFTIFNHETLGFYFDCRYNQSAIKNVAEINNRKTAPVTKIVVLFD